MRTSVSVGCVQAWRWHRKDGCRGAAIQPGELMCDGIMEGLMRGGGKLSVNGWLTRLHRDGATSEHTGRGEKEREVTKRYGCSRLREDCARLRAAGFGVRRSPYFQQAHACLSTSVCPRDRDSRGRANVQRRRGIEYRGSTEAAGRRETPGEFYLVPCVFYKCGCWK